MTAVFQRTSGTTTMNARVLPRRYFETPIGQHLLAHIRRSSEVVPFSVNPEAERLMGRRRDDVIAFDLPPELGYECPVHRRPWDENLTWSEYNGFLWCADCNVDYPSALCIPLHGEPDTSRPWMHLGVQSAIETFLSTTRQAVEHYKRGSSEAARREPQ